MENEQKHRETHEANKRVLWISFLMIAAYMVVEAIGGMLTNSLALLADAGHMLSDALSLGFALLAFVFGEKVADYSKTFGYKRLEILAAVLNGAALILISIYILYEAIKRFQDPPEVASAGMLAIASIGLMVNLFVAWMMMRGGDVKENLNLRGAYLHVISDILGSIGSIAAALLILFFDWSWADPLASAAVALLVLRSGYRVAKSAIHILMEGAPKDVDVNAVIETIQQSSGIQSLHDLHIWSITSGLNALSCHAVVDAHMSIAESERLLHQLESALERLNIHHMTIQLETADHPHSHALLCQVEPDSSGRRHHHH